MLVIKCSFKQVTFTVWLLSVVNGPTALVSPGMLLLEMKSAVSTLSLLILVYYLTTSPL